jgi:hypothetical protein
VSGLGLVTCPCGWGVHAVGGVWRGASSAVARGSAPPRGRPRAGVASVGRWWPRSAGCGTRERRAMNARMPARAAAFVALGGCNRSTAGGRCGGARARSCAARCPQHSRAPRRDWGAPIHRAAGPPFQTTLPPTGFAGFPSVPSSTLTPPFPSCTLALSPGRANRNRPLWEAAGPRVAAQPVGPAV